MTRYEACRPAAMGSDPQPCSPQGGALPSVRLERGTVGWGSQAADWPRLFPAVERPFLCSVWTLLDRYTPLGPRVKMKISLSAVLEKYVSTMDPLLDLYHMVNKLVIYWNQSCLYLECSSAEAWRGPGASVGSQSTQTTPWQWGRCWRHLSRDSWINRCA